MLATFETDAEFANSFRDLLKGQRYEKVVLSILNRSTTFIDNKPLRRVEQQSHGECDFIDQAGAKYDVKLVLTKKQGALLGEKKNSPTCWFKAMLDESAEFSHCMQEENPKSVEETMLYSVMRERIHDINPDEIAILFIPFPIVDDVKGATFLAFATDFLQVVYNKLKENNLVKCNGVYFLYPGTNSSTMVLRNGDTNIREYIDSNELSEYIVYRSKLISLDDHHH